MTGHSNITILRRLLRIRHHLFSKCGEKLMTIHYPCIVVENTHKGSGKDGVIATTTITNRL